MSLKQFQGNQYQCRYQVLNVSTYTQSVIYRQSFPFSQHKGLPQLSLFPVQKHYYMQNNRQQHIIICFSIQNSTTLYITTFCKWLFIIVQFSMQLAQNSFISLIYTLHTSSYSSFMLLIILQFAILNYKGNKQFILSQQQYKLMYFRQGTVNKNIYYSSTYYPFLTYYHTTISLYCFSIHSTVNSYQFWYYYCILLLSVNNSWLQRSDQDSYSSTILLEYF